MSAKSFSSFLNIIFMESNLKTKLLVNEVGNQIYLEQPKEGRTKLKTVIKKLSVLLALMENYSLVPFKSQKNRVDWKVSDLQPGTPPTFRYIDAQVEERYKKTLYLARLAQTWRTISMDDSITSMTPPFVWEISYEIGTSRGQVGLTQKLLNGELDKPREIDDKHRNYDETYSTVLWPWRAKREDAHMMNRGGRSNETRDALLVRPRRK